jgi:hypothetical protein
MAHRVIGLNRVQAVQALPGGVEDLMDRAPACHDLSSPVARKRPPDETSKRRMLVRGGE